MVNGRELLVELSASPFVRGERSLFGYSTQQLRALLADLGEPSYRAGQLSSALYRDWFTALKDISTLPKKLRESLSTSGYKVDLPRIIETFRSVDGTERYLIAGVDGQTVETVWMPDGDGGEAGNGDGGEAGNGDGGEAGFSDDKADEAIHIGAAKTYRRATICVSSQVGCAVNCHFCLTAKLGLQRNLTAGEIAGQVIAVLKQQRVEVGRDRINLVFMGMGEPLLNYEAFMDAVRLLVTEVGLAESRMTVSTSGIVPGILRFAQEPVRPRLAISLNAPNDAVREQVMPITRKWNIEAVLDAVRQVPLRPREKITFEYVLLGGVTDRPEHADEVALLLRNSNMPAKVNLIVWNPGPNVPFAMPLDGDVEVFKQRLIAGGIPAFIRRPRGRDIYAACGQLKRTLA